MVSKSMLNTFPANPNKPAMFVQLAAKCMDYCVAWSGGGRLYYNCVAKPNDSECRNQCLNTFPANIKKTGMFVQLAIKCIDYCVVWSGGKDYITIV